MEYNSLVLDQPKELAISKCVQLVKAETTYTIITLSDKRICFKSLEIVSLSFIRVIPEIKSKL